MSSQPRECATCHVTLSLDDGHEWGDSERLYCWGCAHDEIDILRVTLGLAYAKIKDLQAVVDSATVHKSIELLSDLSAVRHERDRLQAIVDRLPRTADGVPITPGITIWDSIGVQPWEVTGVNTRLGSLSCIYGPDGSFDAICSGYYSTREAAEEAR